jgi:hypothetical protein
MKGLIAAFRIQNCGVTEVEPQWAFVELPARDIGMFRPVGVSFSYLDEADVRVVDWMASVILSPYSGEREIEKALLTPFCLWNIPSESWSKQVVRLI